jgi:hypothetical protein
MDDGREALASDIARAQEEAVEVQRTLECERLMREPPPLTSPPTTEDEMHALVGLIIDERQMKAVH